MDDRSSPPVRYGPWAAATLILLLGVRTQMQQREIDALEVRIDSLAGAVAASPDDPVAGAGPVERGQRPTPKLRAHEALRSSDGSPRSVRDAVPMGDRFVPASPDDRLQHAAMADRISGFGRAERTAELREALVGALEAEDPELQERIRAVVQNQRELERDERREKRQARWEEDALGRLASLSAQAGLEQSQQDALFAILSRSRDLTGEAFRSAREDHSFGEAREKAEKFREEADVEARELLTEQQYSAYEQMRSEEMDRRGVRRKH